MNLNEYLNKCLKTVKYFFKTFIFKYVGIGFFSASASVYCSRTLFTQEQYNSYCMPRNVCYKIQHNKVHVNKLFNPVMCGVKY